MLNNLFTTGLAMLLLMTSCCKDVVTVPEPELPSLHTTILGVNYDFPEPTHYEVYDNRVDCHYYGDGLLLDIILTPDYELYQLPNGSLNSVDFIIEFPNDIPLINFCNTDVNYPIEWDMN